jgi:hypothetical protein
MTSLGRSEFEQHILGAASLAVSAFIALLPTLLLWAWRERRTLYVILSLPVFLGFVAFSLSSAVGFAALNRGSLDEDRRLVSARLFEVKRVIEATGTALRELESIRSVTVLREVLRGLEQDRRWQSSKSCEAATADASRTFCKDYFDVKAEVAKAGEREHLAAKWLNSTLNAAVLKTEARAAKPTIRPLCWRNFWDCRRATSSAGLPCSSPCWSKSGRRSGFISRQVICARNRGATAGESGGRHHRRQRRRIRSP